MTPTQQMFGFALSPVVTLIVVMFGVFWQNRHVDTRISDFMHSMDGRFNDLNTRFKELREDMLFIRADIRDLTSKVVDIDNRLTRIEEQLRQRS